MMNWEKKGVIFKPDGTNPLMKNHAAIPYADILNSSELRIYFSSRNSEGKSIPYYFDTDINNLTDIKSFSKPLLPLGKTGTFDDSGIMPSWVVTVGDKKYMYYIGWNPQVNVSYRLAIGLAISGDGGKTYKKYAEGPIMDRSLDEPLFNTAPCVLYENGSFKMWYISCTNWERINDYPEPQYLIKYAESKDGIHWNRTGDVCIGYDEVTKAVGRPCVYKENGVYKMIFSFRDIVDYRTDRTKSYSFGYAESDDGITWERNDKKLNFNLSKNGWDDTMNEYCTTYIHNQKRYLLYNGNGFGHSGIGYAVLNNE